MASQLEELVRSVSLTRVEAGEDARTFAKLVQSIVVA